MQPHDRGEARPLLEPPRRLGVPLCQLHPLGLRRRLIEVQLEGKKRMLVSEFLRGLSPASQSELRLG